MPNLRELAVSDLRELNLKDWSGRVNLISPDGTRYETDAVSGEALRAIQILYDYRKMSPETGEDITVNEPVVSIALASLTRVPVAGEKWFIQIPEDPADQSDNPTFMELVLSPVRAPEGGKSLGFIRLYPTKAKQS